MGLFAPFDGDHLVPSSRRRGGPKNAPSSRQPIPLHIGVEGGICVFVFLRTFGGVGIADKLWPSIVI